MSRSSCALLGLLIGVLLGWGAASVANYYGEFENEAKKAESFATPYDIRVHAQTPWRELTPLLTAAAQQGNTHIRINGASMYLPCYSPYSKSHAAVKRPTPKTPQTLNISATDSLADAGQWIQERALHGTTVSVAETATADRVAALARLLDAHRHTASWITHQNTILEFRLTESDIFELTTDAPRKEVP